PPPPPAPFSTLQRPPPSTLFPYTTLFRSASGTLAQIIPPSLVLIVLADQMGVSVGDMYRGAFVPGFALTGLYALFIIGVRPVRRSEEHTSELQSRGHLVCRRLREKKNTHL